MQTDHQKIEPLRHKADIVAIRSILDHRIRDLLLFDMITQTGMGLNQVLGLRVEDLDSLAVNDPIPAKNASGSSGFMTETIQASFQRFLDHFSPAPNDYLFKSRKGNKPLTISSVSTMVKAWFREAGLTGLSGTKSLQKTWERHFKSGGGPAGTSPNSAEPVMRPVTVETVKDKVYREISRAIISGRLAPGERLLEEKIAEQMQVSRMPVREALHRLQEAGFISAYKKAGKIVNQLSRKNLDEITTIRIMLETMAVRQAIFRLKESTLNRLEELHLLLINAINRNEIDEMLQLNKQFHFTLYTDADMPILQQIILGLWDRVSPYVHILLREGDAPASCQDVKRDHQGMLEGMRQRDPEAVCNWLKADLIEGRQMVYGLMDKWGVQ